MSNEKKENEKNVGVTNEQKLVLQRNVEIRRCMYEVIDDNTGEKIVGEYLDCKTIFAGEVVRFKVDSSSSKLMRVLMRMSGYPLFDKEGNIVAEDVRIMDIEG